jgi:signal transduction histidine kinase
MVNPNPDPAAGAAASLNPDSGSPLEYDELATLAEAEAFALGTKSVLAQLPLWDASLDIHDMGHQAAQAFEGDPTLPGIILTEAGRLVGMLSRQRFLEYLLRPKGIDLFLAQPLRVMYSYARIPPLVMGHTTPILTAAQRVLRRPNDQQGEPIVVKLPRGDRLLSIHDLNRAHWHIRGIETQIRYERVQAQMLQNEKMAALGRLVDGVSHEILDPLGFIWGNLAHVGNYCNQLMALIDAYEAALPDAPAAVQDLREDIELDYLRQDIPNTIGSIQGGAQRLKQLALSLQNFCHIDDVYPKPTDVHQILNSIVLLLKSRLTTQIEVVRDYEPLPPVTCFAGQLSQVFMNILTNSLDALLERASRQEDATTWDLSADGPLLDIVEPPRITISTSLCRPPKDSATPGQRWVSVVIADNGPGLSPAAQEEVLRSFSVEKRLEKETHLAMSYRIVTAKHGGRFFVRSRSFSDHETAPGIGTEFEVRLPLYPQGD